MVLSLPNNYCTCNTKCEIPEMAPPSSSGSTRTLRLIPWISIFFSLCLGIPFAVAFGHIIPAIGNIFLAISCTLSLYDYSSGSPLLRRLFSPTYEYRIVLGNDDDEEPQKPVNPTLLMLGDLLMAFAMALLFSFTIVEMATSSDWRYYNHGEILGTFASLPYLVTLYVTFRYVFD
jgi:hypothetical protein